MFVLEGLKLCTRKLGTTAFQVRQVHNCLCSSYKSTALVSKMEYIIEHGTSTVEDIRDRLDQVKVVASTCLGITSPLLSSKRFDVCIMDEAGQITLPVSLT